MSKSKSTNTKALAAQVQACNKAATNAVKMLSTFDFTPAYELDRRLKADAKLLAEFVKNPNAVAKREVGLVAPPGTHQHFVDEKTDIFRPRVMRSPNLRRAALASHGLVSKYDLQ